MGLAKTAFMTMVAVMAVNLRLLDAWRLRQEAAAGPANPVPKRQPRRRTVLLAETRARVAAAKAIAAAVADHAGATEPPLE